jgi:hypothetical protein
MARKRTQAPRRLATRKPSAAPPLTRNEAPRADDAEPEPDLGLLLGADLDPAELAASVGRHTARGVSEARTALGAERVVSDILGVADLAAPADATPAEQAEARDELVGAMISWAERDGTPGALALLRVFAVLGTAITRDEAGSAAGRLAASGVADRGWARIVGRPRILRAWSYRDVFGAQGSVSILSTMPGASTHCLC